MYVSYGTYCILLNCICIIDHLPVRIIVCMIWISYRVSYCTVEQNYDKIFLKSSLQKTKIKIKKFFCCYKLTKLSTKKEVGTVHAIYYCIRVYIIWFIEPIIDTAVITKWVELHLFREGRGAGSMTLVSVFFEKTLGGIQSSHFTPWRQISPARKWCT